MTMIEILELYVQLFLQACATLLIMLKAQMISGQDWIETGKHNQDHSSNLKSAPSTTIVLPLKFTSSILSDELVQAEEEADSSTQSIRIVESLLQRLLLQLLQNFMRSLISHILVQLIQKKTFESFLLNKNSPSILLKHSPMILLF